MTDIIDAIERAPSVKMTWAVLLIGILAIIPAWINYDIISKDGGHLYIPVADLFLQGKFHEAIFGTLRPLFLPLYEFLVFLVARITGLGLETSGKLVSAISFIFGTLGIYKITEVLFKNRLMALLSILFFISNRELLWRSVDCLKETLLVCLVVWGNYLVLKGIDSFHKRRYFVSGGLLFLAGSMVRSTSLIFLIAWIIIWVFHKRKYLILRSVIFIGSIATVILLYYCNNKYSWHLPIFRRSFSLSVLTRYDLGFVDMLKLSLVFIQHFIARTYYLITILGLLGFYYLRRNIYSIYYAIAFVIFLFVCVRTGWTFTGRASDRYIIVLVVFLYPLAAYALAKSLRSINRPLKLMAVITILICPMLWGEKVFTPPDKDKLARKEAGEWILDRLGPDQEIISNRERLVFYAQGKYKPLSKYKMKNTTDRVLAIDTKYEEGRNIVEKAHSRGVDSDKQFRSIYVYLPSS